MGYRMDIVKFKFEVFHVTRLWQQDARFSHGPSLSMFNIIQADLILNTKYFISEGNPLVQYQEHTDKYKTFNQNKN